MPGYNKPSAVFQASFSLQVFTRLKKALVSVQRSPGLLASENRGVSSNALSIYLLEAQNLIQDE